MQNYLKTLVLIFFLAIVPGFCWPQTVVSKQVTPSVIKSDYSEELTHLKEFNAQLKESNLLLKEEIKVTKEYHSNLLDTVYWTLTTIGGLTLLLVSVNFFTAWRTRDSDKHLLAVEFDAKSNQLRLDLERKTADALAVKDADFTARTEGLLGRVNQDLNTLRSEVSSNREEQTLALAKQAAYAEAVKDQLMTNKVRFDNDLSVLTATLRDVEVLIWELKDNPVVMIMAQAQSIENARKAGADFMVETGLNKIKAIIAKYFFKEKPRYMMQNSKDFILGKLGDSPTGGELLQEIRTSINEIPTVVAAGGTAAASTSPPTV